jgi:elongation factor 2
MVAGKSTLTDSMLAAAGLMALEDAGKVRATDTRDDEAERGMSIKATAVTLGYDFRAMRTGTATSDRYVVNLVDCPGHVDFSPEVTAALRLTDGALVVVDCVEGVRVQTQTVLRQALGERIKPVLVVNKLDRFFLELEVHVLSNSPCSVLSNSPCSVPSNWLRQTGILLTITYTCVALQLDDGEVAYQALRRVVEDANAVVAMYSDNELGNCHMSPENGTVAFAAGLHGWAFTLSSFAKLHSTNSSWSGVDEAEMRGRFWGENFFDAETNLWTTCRTGSATCERGFVGFCYNPLRNVIKACMNDKTSLWPLLNKFGVEIKAEVKDLSGKQLLRRVMQAWLPAGEVLLDMLVLHLPSPATAQRYRVDNIYDGPLDDPYANAIRNCDADGPLMIYIAKVVPAGDRMGRMYAFGRVFSGKVASGNKVRVISNKYLPGGGGKGDVFVKTVQRTGMLVGKTFQAVDGVPCGNTVALAGLDGVIVKTATLTDERAAVAAGTIKPLKFSVAPILRKSVACRNPADLPKLLKGLERLAKADPLIECSLEETGEHIVAGAGELHLEVCLDGLKRMAGVDILFGAPVVPYRETVVASSSRAVVTKSPNRHNRLYMDARPLEEELLQAIEDGRVGPRDEVTSRAKLLREEFGWDAGDAKKLWCFGPATTGPNLLVNTCKGVYYTGEIRESVVVAFQAASKGGVLAGEPLRGIRFHLCDAVLHSDCVHRGSGQIIPTARRAIHAAQLAASPRLMEPIYLVEIRVPKSAVSEVYNLLKTKVFEHQDLGFGTVVLKAFLPVSESSQFVQQLRLKTSGKAFPELAFHGWRLINSDPLEDGSKAAMVVGKARERKGLGPVPNLEELDATF